MQKILYVEDDLSLIDGLQYTLEASGYMVDNAKTVKEALALFRKNTYDLLLLDVTLPRMAVSPVPIIFLAPLDYMVADAARLPVEGEEGFASLSEQFRPLYPVREAHTAGNKCFAHPNCPVRWLRMMLMPFSELLQLPEQIQLIPFDFDVPFLLFGASPRLFSQQRIDSEGFRQALIDALRIPFASGGQLASNLPQGHLMGEYLITGDKPGPDF